MQTITIKMSDAEMTGLAHVAAVRGWQVELVAAHAVREVAQVAQVELAKAATEKARTEYAKLDEKTREDVEGAARALLVVLNTQRVTALAAAQEWEVG
jgi:hypothetical protein